MSLAKSLPRVREFNTKPPTIWDWNLVAQKVNRLVDWVKELEASIDDADTTSTTASLDSPKFAFGCSISGSVVTIQAGNVYRGFRTVIAVGKTTKTITATHQYIPLAIDLTANTAQIENPTTTLPQSTSSIFRVWLVRCTLTNGVATIVDGDIGHVGNLYLPGAGA